MQEGEFDTQTPILGFGCSALLGRSGRSDSLRALQTAWSEGIRFFDTARSYGYGESEALLGEFLRGRREEAVVATKFGILPTRQTGWKRVAKSLARRILAAAPAAPLRSSPCAAGQFNPGQFTVAVLRESIEQSLHQLGTDCVDLLFLHAAPASVLEQDDLLEAMSRLVEAGKVRRAGISAEPAVVELAIKRQTRPLRAMQFPCNVFDLSAAMRLARQNSQGHLLVANQPFGGVERVRECRARLLALAKDERIDALLREKLGAVNDEVFADVVLNVILRGTGIHVAIPAMMRVEHIRTNVRALAASRFDAGEIARLRAVLAQ